MHEVQSLSVRMEKLEHPPPSPQPHPPPSVFQPKCPVFGCPALTALPNGLKIPNLDFSSRRILWTPVVSTGVSLPLPLDSSCSTSLISQSHADVICEKSPQLTYQKLEQPIPVAVATLATQLEAVAVLQVPITWENGQSSIFPMLVMPNLTWSISFGQNHLGQTQAVTDHANYHVRFNYQALNFTVNCRNSSLFEAFPSSADILNSGESASGANITCLLTSTPLPNSPKEQVQLHRGFNIVTLCLALAASLVGTSALTSPLWLDGQKISPGVHVVSALLSLTEAQTHMSSVSLQLNDFRSFTGPFNYPKCHPNQPLPEPEPVHTGVLSAEHVDTISQLSDIPDFITTYQVNVLVRSTRNTASFLMHATLSNTRAQTSADSEVFEEATAHTASNLADMCYNFAQQIPVNANDHVCNDTNFYTRKSAYASAALKSWQPRQQQEEMKKAGLHSSLLSQFLDDHDADHALPSMDPVYSEEYYETLVNALDLNSPTYSNISESDRSDFKNLLLRCPEAFHIPGFPLVSSRVFIITQTLESHPLCTSSLIVRVQLNYLQLKLN